MELNCLNVNGYTMDIYWYNAGPPGHVCWSMWPHQNIVRKLANQPKREFLQLFKHQLSDFMGGATF